MQQKEQHQLQQQQHQQQQLQLWWEAAAAAAGSSLQLAGQVRTIYSVPFFAAAFHSCNRHLLPPPPAWPVAHGMLLLSLYGQYHNDTN